MKLKTRHRSRVLVLLVAGFVAFVAAQMNMGQAQAAVDCDSGYVCLFRGTGYSGIWDRFSSYDYNGTWRNVASYLIDQAESIYNNQNTDVCNNDQYHDADPWVYFADSGPSGKVGALFFSGPSWQIGKWETLGYYSDRIDVRYNRCNAVTPSYIPKNAF